MGMSPLAATPPASRELPEPLRSNFEVGRPRGSAPQNWLCGDSLHMLAAQQAGLETPVVCACSHVCICSCAGSTSILVKGDYSPCGSADGEHAPLMHGQVSLVLEYCDLGSLRDALDGGAFVLGEAFA